MKNDIIVTKKNVHWVDELIPSVSIVTSVYNRKKDLPRALKSVEMQEFRDFEYIIVDNGSTEKLDDIVDEFMSNVDFPVLYIKKEFGGPHAGRNRGKVFARGKYLVTLDSDDEILPNALLVLKETWDSIPDEEKPKYWEVVCLCKDETGKVVGDLFPSDINDLSMKLANEASDRTGGEHFSMDLTKIHQTFLFPEPDGITYITESLIWDQIKSKGYKSYYINEQLRVYYMNSEDSITNINKRKKTEEYCINSLWTCQYILNNWNEFSYSFKQFIFFILRYSVYANVLLKRKKTYLLDNSIELKGLRNYLFKTLMWIPSKIGAQVYIKKNM